MESGVAEAVERLFHWESGTNTTNSINYNQHQLLEVTEN